MYEAFFGLTEKPFSLTPNPRFVFQSEQYRAAGEAMLYGIAHKEGFMLVTGHPGTGKTTLCRDLLEKLGPAQHRVALMFNPFLNGVEMLRGLLAELRVPESPSDTRKDLVDRLNTFLLHQLAEGRTVTAIFDEAQHLSPEFLEQIRVLSNLETEQEKLLQIVLVGQPELLKLIRTPNMAQLDQRVSVRCTLTHLDRVQTERYIYHRLNVAGAQGRVEFSRGAMNRIFTSSTGIPRLINLTCDRALLSAFADQNRKIKPAHVREAVASLRGDEDGETNMAFLKARSARTVRSSRPLTLWLAGAAAALAAVGVWQSDILRPRDATRTPALAMRPASPVARDSAVTVPSAGAETVTDTSSVAAAPPTSPTSSQPSAADDTTGSAAATAVQAGNATAAPPIAASDSPPIFGVQIAALDSLSDATQLRDTLAARGYAVAVAPCQSRHCVRIGPFATRSQAREMTRVLKERRVEGVVVNWTQP